MRTGRLISHAVLSLMLVALMVAPLPAAFAQEATSEATLEPPTEAPTTLPTDVPTEPPTEIPTEQPTAVPTEAPTELPTVAPSIEATPEVTPIAEVTAEPTLPIEPTAEATWEVTVETLLGAPVPLVARVEPVTEASLMAAKVFVVNDTADTADPNSDFVCDVNPGMAGNQCTLRAAIQEANNNPGKDTINFNIPGTGPHTILVTAAVLPSIAESVIINGMSEPGYTWLTPQIVLDGNGLGGSGLVLTSTANGSIIKGLVINHGWTEAILVQGANNLIQANFLGVEADGTTADGNTYGVYLTDASATTNTIGGTTAALRNLISGNSNAGIYVTTSANGNRMQSNYIGTTKTGTAAVPGAQDGVEVVNSQGTIIGSGGRNVISGNGATGVTITGLLSTVNVISGNYIGVNAAGTLAVPNTSYGVIIRDGAGNNRVGGTTTAARNVISGNSFPGVYLFNNANGNRVQGNYIGTNAAGTLAIGNTVGVTLDVVSDNVIGGTSAAARNVISGNSEYGVRFTLGASNNVVLGNYIGTNAAGTGPLGNAISGVYFLAGNDNSIGGTLTGAGNRIAYNGDQGISVDMLAAGNRLLGNSIYGNTGLGIDLDTAADPGVTSNDLDDLDGGANNRQNFPNLTDMRGSRFVGSLNSTANNVFRLQFFANPPSTCDGSDHGEGQRYLGTAVVLTNSGGDVSFDLTATPAVTVPAGWTITATATSASGDTSEFSECILANLGVPALVSPANNALVTTTSPQFKWGAVANATQYWLQISYDPGFLTAADFAIVAAPTVTSNPTNPLRYGESYYWRVRAVAGAQLAPWSATRRINIVT